MKVLLDECLDVRLRLRLTGHDAFSVTFMGWNGIKNGALLSRAVAAGFDVFVTTDGGIQHQQHVAAMPIALVVLLAASNEMRDIDPLIPKLLVALNHVVPR